MTLFKQFIVTGTVLSLMFIAMPAKAMNAGLNNNLVPLIVTNNNDVGFGSLRDAVIQINNFPMMYDEITFNAGFDINLTSVLPTFTVPTVTISGVPGLKIHLNNNPTNIIFNAGATDVLLVGNDAGGDSNWFGSMTGAGGGIIRLEQQTSSTYPGTISGPVALICQGANQTLTFNNASVYTGNTFIPGGILRVGFQNALPTNGTVSITVGGTLEIGNGFAQTVAGLNGDGAVTIGNDGILEIDSIANSTFGGIIGGAGKLVKQGTGILTLSNSSNYANGTDIIGGTLIVDFNNALPQTGFVTIGAGANLEIATARTQTLESISGSGGITIGNAGTLIMNTVADGSFAGNISGVGSGTFVKGGTHTLTLSGVNAGNLQITGGAIKIITGSSWTGPVNIGAAILDMNGGSYSGNIVGTAGSTMNVNSILTAPGAITVDTLNINTGATFTPSANVITNALLNVRQGGTLLLANDIRGAGGTVVNAGTVTHTACVPRSIAGNFRQESTGIINIGILDAQHYSQFLVGGNTQLNGGIMNILLFSTGNIQGGEVFDIITSTGGITNNMLPTVPRLASLPLSFTPIVRGNKLQLIVNRRSYKFINNIPALDGIAMGLDNLRVSNPLHPLVGFVDGITSQNEFETLLEQLAPAGLNGMYTALGLGATNQILSRLDTIRETDTHRVARLGYTQTGYAAGDIIENRGTYSPILFGNSAKQSTRAGLPGFDAHTGGFGILWDVPILECFCVGVGATYANSLVKQSNHTGSHTTIGNTQGVFYGSALYDALFLDGVLSAGFNRYRGKRNITLLRESVKASYKGLQNSGKFRMGFTWPCCQVEISPMAAFQYLYLNVNRYREQGASNLDLSLDPTRIFATRAYFGGRITKKDQEENFFSEIHAYYIQDIKNPNVLITSQFIAGGGAFVSRGVRAPKNGVNVGASITALMSENFSISGCYDFEGKTSFHSHSLSFKLKYLF